MGDIISTSLSIPSSALWSEVRPEGTKLLKSSSKARMSQEKDSLIYRPPIEFYPTDLIASIPNESGKTILFFEFEVVSKLFSGVPQLFFFFYV